MTFNQHIAYIERAQVSDLHFTTYYVLNDHLNPCEYTLVFLLIKKVSIFLGNSFLYQKSTFWSVFYGFVKRQLPPPPPPAGAYSEYRASLIFAMLLSSECRISNIEYHANFTLPMSTGKALSLCQFVASFKKVSLKSDFIHNFSCFYTCI